MNIRNATLQDIPIIHDLAEKIWWPTYTAVIPEDQISFMLEKMYSEQALKEQFEEGIRFLVLEEADQALGFASFSVTDPEDKVYKIHKLYVLPSEQGKGLGKMLIDYIAEIAEREGGQILELNVNRNNPAFNFYKKQGFVIYQLVDIPYYHFILNDYVMRKHLSFSHP